MMCPDCMRYVCRCAENEAEEAALEAMTDDDREQHRECCRGPQIIAAGEVPF